MGSFDDEQLLVELKCIEGFGLGVPIDGAEDPVVPTVFRHDALLQFGAASCFDLVACGEPMS